MLIGIQPIVPLSRSHRRDPSAPLQPTSAAADAPVASPPRNNAPVALGFQCIPSVHIPRIYVIRNTQRRGYPSNVIENSDPVPHCIPEYQDRNVANPGPVLRGRKFTRRITLVFGEISNFALHAPDAPPFRPPLRRRDGRTWNFLRRMFSDDKFATTRGRV